MEKRLTANQRVSVEEFLHDPHSFKIRSTLRDTSQFDGASAPTLEEYLPLDEELELYEAFQENANYNFDNDYQEALINN